MCFLFIVICVVGVIDHFNKKEKLERHYLEIKAKADELVSALHKYAFAVANNNNKIGNILYDIEEGGHYLRNQNEKDIANVNTVLKKYTAILDTKDNVAFIKAYYTLEYRRSILTEIETDILNLPTGKSYAIGF